MNDKLDQELVAKKMWREFLKREQEKARRDDRLRLAGLAMQGLIAQGGSDVWSIAHQSLQMADAMMEVADGQAQG
jgi:hypothetical protein